MNSETAWDAWSAFPRRFQEVRFLNEILAYPSPPPEKPHWSPPDSLINSPAFTRLSRRNRARFLFGILRLRRGLDPSNPLDAELADAVDIECDRLSSLLRVSR